MKVFIDWALTKDNKVLISDSISTRNVRLEDIPKNLKFM